MTNKAMNSVGGDAWTDGGAWIDRPHRLLVWAGAVLLMIVPIIAIGGVDEPPVFVILGFMASFIGLAYEVALRVPQRLAWRAATGIGALTFCALIWVNGAVGIIKGDDNPQNWIYAAVIGTALLGTLLARFRPQAMAKAMLATALVQVIVFLIPWLLDWQFTGPATVFFTSLWLVSALLFRKAAQGQ